MSGLRGPFQRVVRRLSRRVLRPLAAAMVPAGPRLPPERWGLSAGSDGALRLHGVELRSLVERWGSPLHVVDRPRLEANAARFLAPAAPDVRVFYSYKTNPVPGVLAALHRRGLGAEVVSPFELWLALRLGVEPGAIVYNGPAKSEASVEEALRLGIALLNVNARAELARIAAAARRLRVRPRVGVRVAVPGSWGGQLGERADDGAAMRAFEEALGCAELDVVGLHVHLGGEIASLPELDAFLSQVLAFTDALADRLRFRPRILDLGGNLAAPTVSRRSTRQARLARALDRDPPGRAPEEVLPAESYVARVAERVRAHHAARGVAAPSVYLEPGRAVTSDAQLLLARVLQIRDPDEHGVGWAVLDAGLNAAEPLRGERHRLFAAAPRPGAPERSYRLAGPSCMVGDLLVPSCVLPELRRGDVVAIMDAGAYFVPFSTCFSFPRAGVVMVSPEGTELLRRPETFDDLVARDAPTAFEQAVPSPRRASAAEPP